MSDTRIIIARQGPHEILKHRQEVLWDDGSHIWLHTTRLRGNPCLFTRATALGNGHWALVDLRQIDPTFDEDLPRLPESTHPARVFYTLRRLYATADLLLQDMAFYGQFLTDELARPLEAAA